MSSESLLDGPNVSDSIPAERPQPLGADRAPRVARALILLCTCFLTFGSYWVFDTPGAIQSQLTEWFGPDNYDKTKNSLLYSIYSWPNTVLAMFGGFIVDRVTGVRKGALLFCTLIWLGQLTFCFGIQTKNYPLCVVGRFIFGLGGESLTVVQNTFVVRWFSGPYVALIFGLVLAFARVGSSVNFAVTPTLTDEGVPFSVWFGAGMCTLSLIACIFLVILDYANASYVEAPPAADPQDAPQQVQHNEDGTVVEVREEPNDELPSIKQILRFPREAWVLFLICMFFYQGVLTFYQVASLIMQNTGRHFSEKTASLFLAIPNFVSIFASPTFGRLVDRRGFSVTFIVVASLSLMLCHVMFLADVYDGEHLVLYIHPTIILALLGFAYALGAASMWPMLALIVPKNLVSTGYGTMTAVQNVGLSVFPLVISSIQSARGIEGTTDEYGVPTIIFIGCVMISCILALYLRKIDAAKSGILNASAEERSIIKMRQEAAEAALAEAEAQHQPPGVAVVAL